MRPPVDVWASGAAYERYVGRWSRPVAREFLEWLRVPTGSAWLDVGAGTGALSQTVLSLAAPSRVHAVDASWPYVRHARSQLMDERMRFVVADGHDLPLAGSAVDVAVSGLVLNFLARPEAALAEMTRVVRSGGVVAVYVWDYAGRMELMRHFWDAAAESDPRAAALDEGRRFPLCHPEPLERLFNAGALGDVEVRPIDVPTRFRDFDDYWSPFEGGQGPAPSYLMSLDEPARARLRERVRARLPFGEDGSLDLVARAWAVRGYRP